MDRIFSPSSCPLIFTKKMEKETPHTPEDCAKHINNIMELQHKREEKTLDELLSIFEHDGYVSTIQDVCFMFVIQNYSGKRFEEYMNRYLKVANKYPEQREDCFGL